MPIYFGPPIGFYNFKKFKDFAEIDIPQRLKETGVPSNCNFEEHSDGSVTFHYPDAGLGLSYSSKVPERCMVSLYGARVDTMKSIESFLEEKDNEPIQF